MNKKLVTISSSIAVTALLTSVSPAYSAINCVNQYGTSVPYGNVEVCAKTGEIQVNKEVFDPKTQKFVDNLGISAYKFAQGEEVTFRLKIKNIGDNTLDKVQVTDTLPSILEPIDASTLSFELSNLKVDETVEKTIKVRVKPLSQLARDKSTICDVNTAEVKSGDKSDRDTAQICIEKKAPGQLPKAGATDTFVNLFGSLVFALTGFKLFRLRTVK